MAKGIKSKKHKTNGHKTRLPVVTVIHCNKTKLKI
jgi:hypothetical protein